MSRMNRDSLASRNVRHWVLLCCGVCLAFSLLPCADLDAEGSFDSSVGGGFVLNAFVPTLELPAFMFRQPRPDRVWPAEAFPVRIPHPPKP